MAAQAGLYLPDNCINHAGGNIILTVVRYIGGRILLGRIAKIDTAIHGRAIIAV